MQPQPLKSCLSKKPPMKCLGLLWTALVLAAMVSCEKEPGPINNNLIPVNKCQVFDYTGESITCCLDSVIADSRCPIDGICIWQGSGIARFKVSTSNTLNTITLATFKYSIYNKDTTVAGFKIELVNLSPVSRVNQPVNYKDYVAQVAITKL